jgi:hypothetical protein
MFGVPSSEALVSALADPRRLTLFARIAAAPAGIAGSEIEDSDRHTAKHLNQLISAGLVVQFAEGHYRAVPEIFRDALAAAKPTKSGDKNERALEALFRDGKLTTIPRSAKLRNALLVRLAQSFEPQRVYTEKDVRDVLAEFYDDQVTLRRYLVDAGHLERGNQGLAYRRATTVSPVELEALL